MKVQGNLEIPPFPGDAVWKMPKILYMSGSAGRMFAVETARHLLESPVFVNFLW